MRLDEQLDKEYRRLNRRLFGNSLREVIIAWETGLCDAQGNELDGEISDELIKGSFVLRINEKFREWKNQWLIIMVHEMAHLHIWPYERHGAAWDMEMVRISKYKTFRKLI